MRYKFPFLFLLFLLPVQAFSQLQLQSVDSGRKKSFKPGQEIILTLPGPGVGDPCDNYILYQGTFKGMEDGKARMVLRETIRVHPADAEGVLKREVVSYKFQGVERDLQIPLEGLMTVTKVRTQQGLAGTLMVLSLLQGLVVGPLLLEGDTRKISDLSVLAAFSTSVVLFANNKKHYHLQQPKGRKARLWKLAG